MWRKRGRKDLRLWRSAPGRAEGRPPGLGYSNQLVTRAETKEMAGPRQNPVISVVSPTVDPTRKPMDKTEMSQSMRTPRALSLLVCAEINCGMAS